MTPEIVGKNGINLFRGIEKSGVQLELVRNEIVEKKYVHLVYRVLKK
ncbi:5-amino-6-(5-phosphoribosylamino)uracil reductase [Methanosarcina lacustris Z-7289]|uniref:5-amino-6-(5-phosphoribosylamino)uracil reductase n=1 Tax=Methanosarcina lacustris Z-7289 TaxID=1434111 RepID=A0A0E3SAI1_9EURY|nr:5-amino-6-(5-phosphoribosylamino)uracil reductase [Methanosarcina lacustris Z-7289]